MANQVLLSVDYIPNPSIGRALSLADIYVGIVDLDPKIVGNQKQISVLQENGTTVQVAQPISTSTGGVPLYNGSPVTILVDGSYSLRIDDSTGTQQYYVPKNAELESLSSIANIAALKAITTTPADGDIFNVLGYYASTENRDWQFQWDASSIASDNAGTIIKVAAITTGRWLRLVDNPNTFNIEWFDVDNTGTSFVQDEIQAIIDLTPSNGIIEFETDATYKILGDPAVHFDRTMGIRFNNCTFNYEDSRIALRWGSGPSNGRFFEGWMQGHVRIRRTEAIIIDGSQTAVSQLKGTGLDFCGIQDSSFIGSAYVYGFKYGYAFTSQATVLDLHNLQAQTCLVDFHCNPNERDSNTGNYVTALNFFGGHITFGSSQFSTVLGTAVCQLIFNEPIDGIVFFGTALEGITKERKIYCEASQCAWNNVYWDKAGGGTDFEFTATSFNNTVSGGASLVVQKTIDNGTGNDVSGPADIRASGETKTINFGQSGTLQLQTSSNDAFSDLDFFSLLDATAGYVIASLTKVEAAIGDGTTQYDITNPSGDTFRYTYDGTGTDPGLTATSHHGTIVISGGTFNALNTGSFKIIDVGANFFEITNAVGVAETNVVGAVSWYISESGHWVFDEAGQVTLVSGTDSTIAGLAIDEMFSCGPDGTMIKIYNRMRAICKLRVTAWFN